MASDPWGIEDGYWDAQGTWHETPAETRAALRAAMHAPADTIAEAEAGQRRDQHHPAAPTRPIWFVRAGTPEPLLSPCDVTLESGDVLHCPTHLPADLPLGYHELDPIDGGPNTRLIVSPRRCPNPPERTWGLTAQLYGARSRRSWGFGDFSDLRVLAGWLAARGAGVVATNPFHAVTPVGRQQSSPYYPSSRMFRNPCYLDVEAVPGAADVGATVTHLASAARQLNAQRRIDRDEVWRLKRATLEVIWPRVRDHLGEMEQWSAAQGSELEGWATYCALAEEHGASWRVWPKALRSPKSADVIDYRDRHRGRVGFHVWLQWLLDQQLASALVDAPAFVNDIAVGFDPHGFDAWWWQDAIADGIEVGAPPDGFNPGGQRWGIPPFVPWRLWDTHFEPLIATLRAAFAHSGGVRVDHVMGLSRLFWIPAGGHPIDGTYVRYPFGPMLDLVALEASRAGAFVIGEDLGTVEPEVRAELADRGLLSTRLVWFEDRDPAEFPEQAVAAVTTHDLPTIAGVWRCTDLAERLRIDPHADRSGDAFFRSRIRALTDLDAAASTDDVIVAMYTALARSPSAVLTAALEDALGVEEATNMPGTLDEWPNWSLALPEPLENALASPSVIGVAAALTRATSDVAAEGEPVGSTA